MTIPTGGEFLPPQEQPPAAYPHDPRLPKDPSLVPGGQRSAASTTAGVAILRKVLPLARLGRKLRTAFRPRRVLGLMLTLGMAYTVFHVVFRTELLSPLIAQAAPLQAGIDWALEDPSRVVTSLCVVIIPHLGLYHLIFERR